jgi:hypothetical protein
MKATTAAIARAGIGWPDREKLQRAAPIAAVMAATARDGPRRLVFDWQDRLVAGADIVRPV